MARDDAPVLTTEPRARPSSPDHAYYIELKDRLGAQAAAPRAHVLRELGDAAIAPAQ